MMKTLRHYFISDNLDDLEVFEEQLEEAGVATPQIHVHSTNDAEIKSRHRLHDITSFMKKDVVHSTEIGRKSTDSKLRGNCLAGSLMGTPLPHPE